MKIISLSQAFYRSPEYDKLSINQLRAIIIKEILQFPGVLPIIDEGRIKECLRKLKDLKDKGEIKKSVGTLIMDGIDYTLFETKDIKILKLSPEQRTEMSEKALRTLSRLMKEVVYGK